MGSAAFNKPATPTEESFDAAAFNAALTRYVTDGNFKAFNELRESHPDVMTVLGDFCLNGFYKGLEPKPFNFIGVHFTAGTFMLANLEGARIDGATGLENVIILVSTGFFQDAVTAAKKAAAAKTGSAPNPASSIG